ncbi:MAG: tRNA guanosine(34) transglycosylase Tgt [Planctomycetota bacterium]
MQSGFIFQTIAQDGGARVGQLATPHGVVETPAFMPVGTRGSVKGVLPEQLKDLGAQILLANTYHLTLRPGEKTVRTLGGLHLFTGWSGPILTDSGGFQVLSLAARRHIDDSGVRFRSHIDGSELFLDPERVLGIEAELGTDIAMVLDHCPAPTANAAELRVATERTLLWAGRSARTRESLNAPASMAVFAIQQGGADANLRDECADRLLEIDAAGVPFDGFAVGGVSVGEDRARLLATIPISTRKLPVDRPRYLMGVSGFQEYVRAIDAGVDLFDCVLPTRNARNGYLFCRSGEVVRIKNSRYQADPAPIEASCDCRACRGFSRGFLHHLLRNRELVAYTLASIHNLRVFHRFLEDARAAIRAGTWGDFRAAWW